MGRALPAWLLAVVACSTPVEPAAPVYASAPPEGMIRPLTLGVHPLHNPRRLERLFGPVADALSQCLGQPVRLEASRGYAAFEKKLSAGEFDFAMPNPYQAVRARDEYRVFAKQADDSLFRGVLLARKGEPPLTLTDLKDRRIAFPAPTALAAAMMPQLLLARAGLQPGRDYQPVYVGSQESAIAAVLQKSVDVAATWPVPWAQFQSEQPAQAATLEVRWSTPILINNAFVARRTLADDLVTRARDCLLAYSPDDPTIERAQVTFEAANDAQYDVVELVVRVLERLVTQP